MHPKRVPTRRILGNAVEVVNTQGDILHQHATVIANLDESLKALAAQMPPDVSTWPWRQRLRWLVGR